MIVECTRGFGKVVNPINGEEIDVQDPLEVDEETFKALDAEYPGFRIVDDEPQGKESEGGTVETCDEIMTNGKVCGRELPCPYHSEK